MTNQELNKIQSLYEDGTSIRQIARQMGLNYGKVRYHLVKKGVHKSDSKYVVNGRVACLQCGEDKSLQEFPAYESAGVRKCKDCLNEQTREYGLQKLNCTTEHYDTLYQDQDGKCDICQTEIGHVSCNGTEARLAVDHCHTTGNVRGLLCNNCNRGLGFFKDNPSLLDSAIQYLKKHGASWN